MIIFRCQNNSLIIRDATAVRSHTTTVIPLTAIIFVAAKKKEAEKKIYFSLYFFLLIFFQGCPRLRTRHLRTTLFAFICAQDLGNSLCVLTR